LTPSFTEVVQLTCHPHQDCQNMLDAGVEVLDSRGASQSKNIAAGDAGDTTRARDEQAATLRR